MKTPTIHFDYITKKYPEGAALFEIVRDLHSSFTEYELRDGICAPQLDLFDGTSRVMNYLMMLYDRFGQNTYVIGPKVQDLFRRTNLAKVSLDMIQGPQPAFYIALPNCPWRLWGGERTQWHVLSGVYVSFTRAASVEDREGRRDLCMHFCLWGGPNERSLTGADDAILWYTINLEEWIREGEDMETFFQGHRVMLADEHDVDYWRGSDPLHPRYDDINLVSPPAIPSTIEDVLEQRITLTNVLRLAINLCLYMGMEDPDLLVEESSTEAADLKKQITTKKSDGKRKKLERRLANLPKVRIVYVGPMFESLGESGPSPEHKGGSHASPIEHGVGPHWQRYWVGSGKERHIRWTLKGMYVRGSGKPDRTITKLHE